MATLAHVCRRLNESQPSQNANEEQAQLPYHTLAATASYTIEMWSTSTLRGFYISRSTDRSSSSLFRYRSGRPSVGSGGVRTELGLVTYAGHCSSVHLETTRIAIPRK